MVYVRLHAKLHVQGVQIRALPHVKTNVKTLVEKIHAQLCVMLFQRVQHREHHLVTVLVPLVPAVRVHVAVPLVQVDAKVNVPVYAAHARESVTVPAPVLVVPCVVKVVALTAI